MGDSNVNLPPGFRFYPTDEELVVHFLHRKAALLPCHPDVIPDLDLHPYDPWELGGRALAEGNQWYYYSRKTQNRVTANGYWNPMGMEEPVVSSSSNRRVGMKKFFVFYVGEAPDGNKTNWIMQEYRLSDSGSASSSRSTRRKAQPKSDYSKWVICRVYERDENDDDGDGTELSCLDEVFLSLDDLDEGGLLGSSMMKAHCNNSHVQGFFGRIRFIFIELEERRIVEPIEHWKGSLQLSIATIVLLGYVAFTYIDGIW